MMRAATRPSASRTSVVGVALIGVFSANASLIAGVSARDHARVGDAVGLGERGGRLGRVDRVDAEERDVLALERCRTPSRGRRPRRGTGRTRRTRSSRPARRRGSPRSRRRRRSRSSPRTRPAHRARPRGSRRRRSRRRCIPCCRPRGTARRAGRSCRRRADSTTAPASRAAVARSPTTSGCRASDRPHVDGAGGRGRLGVVGLAPYVADELEARHARERAAAVARVVPGGQAGDGEVGHPDRQLVLTMTTSPDVGGAPRIASSPAFIRATTCAYGSPQLGISGRREVPPVQRVHAGRGPSAGPRTRWSAR